MVPIIQSSIATVLHGHIDIVRIDGIVSVVLLGIFEHLRVLPFLDEISLFLVKIGRLLPQRCQLSILGVDLLGLETQVSEVIGRADLVKTVLRADYARELYDLVDSQIDFTVRKAHLLKLNVDIVLSTDV